MERNAPLVVKRRMPPLVERNKLAHKFSAGGNELAHKFSAGGNELAHKFSAGGNELAHKFSAGGAVGN